MCEDLVSHGQLYLTILHMPKQSIIDSLKQILRETDEPACVNWAHANLVVRSNAPALSANDSSYGGAAPKSVRGNVKKGAIAA